MKITPVTQYKNNNTNLKGVETKYSQRVLEAIN